MNEQITVHDIISHMDFLAPPERAEEWDHIGLMVGSHQSEVKGVVLSLDVTTEAIDICKHTGANLIITHHPLFFTPCFSIDILTPRGKLIELLFQDDISVFSAHTNLDGADHSVNHALADALGLTPVSSSAISRFGLFCSTKESVKYIGYSEWIREKLGSSGVFLNNNDNVDIKNLCLCAVRLTRRSYPRSSTPGPMRS